MGGTVQHPRGWAAAVVVMALAGPAAAQSAEVQANASVNLGYSQTTQTVFVPDPNGMPIDMPDDRASRVFTEIRPGISVQSGTPRLTWRAGYVFAGTLSLVGDSLSAYSNELSAALAAQATELTTVSMTGTASQGGTSFLLTQQPADAGKAEIRAPENPDRIAASLAESLTTQLAKHFTLTQGLVASVNAPQTHFGQRNTAVSVALGVDRQFDRDEIGAQLFSTVSWLLPLQAKQSPYKSYASSLGVHWNRDFSPSWNGRASVGIEQVFTDTGSRPLAFLPAGSLGVQYNAGDNLSGGVEFSHGTATNLQVGSVSITDRVGVHGVIALDPRENRGLAFSAGFLHNEPLGQISAMVAAGTGNAAQFDAGFTTRLAKNVLGSVRYSLAYQYGQGAGLPSTLAHIFFVGVTGSIRNTDRPSRPLPSRGTRVDGVDGQGFRVVDDAAGDEAPKP